MHATNSNDDGASTLSSAHHAARHAQHLKKREMQTSRQTLNATDERKDCLQVYIRHFKEGEMQTSRQSKRHRWEEGLPLKCTLGTLEKEECRHQGRASATDRRKDKCTLGNLERNNADFKEEQAPEIRGRTASQVYIMHFRERRMQTSRQSERHR